MGSVSVRVLPRTRTDRTLETLRQKLELLTTSRISSSQEKPQFCF